MLVNGAKQPFNFKDIFSLDNIVASLYMDRPVS